ncbi:aminotransferase-like domain-containing protein [Mucilaginibacter myungsuensis]|uniref:PLP-dependent aminotransferase family protein n=1 Tax=Mucilaginibacter myungsuensis TaxID=649104 RepID=A0A929L1R9_9SPHI|nr:PLP-dependent aminotransferase family protein [Mucilaginibacter myungsuensis]MBE9664028.1 PLP-dependent aminotransferase family protein [Mucilaginibacter myungsuensis]MDN3601207.1 PLP-dependent aminotransferase family protein [Mucilaginibacter myungsuensis]
MLATSLTPETDFLYGRIVSHIAEQISGKLIKAGDKLPSVRALSKEQGISISTAFKAYTELENMGLIEARTKSGYYVKYLAQRSVKLPETKMPANEHCPTSVTDMIAMVYNNMAEEGVLRLSLAAPPLSLLPLAKLSKSMMEAIRNSPTANVHYESVQGTPALRKQIAKNAFSWGGHITADDVVTTQGCKEALLFCLRAVTKPGDTVAIESPTYFGIFNVMLSLDLKVLEIPVDAETGIDLDHLEQAMDKTDIKACLFVTNFSNPVGSCMSDKRKQRLVNMVTERQIPLIEDDLYGDIYFGDRRPRTCKSYDTEGWVMLCSSVSKSLAPGYRVGWCIPGRFKQQIINIKMMHTITSATPTQAAVAHFFETGRYDLHMRKLRKALYTQHLQYSQAINNYFPEGTKISRPAGGYALWVELDKSIDAFELYKAAIQKNISIAPGQIFSTDARFTNFIRISFGIPYDDAVDKSFKVLGGLVKGLMN